MIDLGFHLLMVLYLNYVIYAYDKTNKRLYINLLWGVIKYDHHINVCIITSDITIISDQIR